MADWELTYPIVGALLARVAANLPAALALSAAGQSDEIAAQLVAPEADRLLRFAPPPAFLTLFPTIGTLDIDSTVREDTGSDAIGVHKIGLVVYLSTPDQAVLVDSLRLYMGAIARAVMVDRGLPSEASRAAAWGFVFDGVSWGDTFADEENPRAFMSWATARWTFNRDEIQ